MKRLMPNSNNLSVIANGRTYRGVSGTPYEDVPDFDASILSANGWEVLAPSEEASRYVISKVDSNSNVLSLTSKSGQLVGRLPMIGEYVNKASITESGGLLLCNARAVSRTTYSALFAEIGTTFGAGNGTTTFNLPDGYGRVLGSAGQSVFTSTFPSTAVIVAANDITVPSNESLYTGTAVVLSTTGNAPGGLTAGNTYYAIRESATLIMLATTRANAIAGTAIDITSQGSGDHTLTVTYTNRTVGSVVGEDSHGLTTAEMPSHTHPFEGVLTSSVIGAAGSAVRSNTEGKTTSATGGSTSHNIMQPTLFGGYLFIYAGDV